ncbi:MAG: hypothetical protein P1U65_17335, partial [Minwuia sp.]|nr:hypothetical protein [Minwuia sp.]
AGMCSGRPEGPKRSSESRKPREQAETDASQSRITSRSPITPVNRSAQWIKGDRKTARRDQLDFVISLWERHAKHTPRRVSLTEDHLREIKEQRRRTGVEPKALFKSPFNPPEDLSVQLVQNWLQGAVKTVREDHLNYVLSSWRGLSDVFQVDPALLGVKEYDVVRGRVVLSSDIVKHLRDLRDISGRSSTAILKAATQKGLSIPSGLNPAEISRWFSGQAKTASPRHLALVIDVYEALQDANMEITSLSEKDVGVLADFHERGISAEDLLKESVKTPADLSAAMINGLLSGRTKAGRKDHLNWLLARCETVSKLSSRRVPVTPEVISRLESARARSGVSQAKFLERARHVPSGLSAAMISHWINGYVATARKDWLDWTITQWEAAARNRGK